jgi:membrane associated rhomboid family serine protease
LIPFGYWAATLARQLERVAAFSLIAVLAALLAAGLILVPAAFALRGATPLDWIAAVSGVGIGAALTLVLNQTTLRPRRRDRRRDESIGRRAPRIADRV